MEKIRNIGIIRGPGGGNTALITALAALANHKHSPSMPVLDREDYQKMKYDIDEMLEKGFKAGDDLRCTIAGNVEKKEFNNK